MHTVISTTGDRTNNHRMQKPKFYPWATLPNVFWRYVFLTEDTVTSGATSSQVGVMNPHNVNLMGWKQNYILYLNWGIIVIFELSWLENSANTYMRHTEHWTAVSTLLGFISSAYRDLEIEPTTTVCRSRNYQTIIIIIFLNYLSLLSLLYFLPTSHTSTSWWSFTGVRITVSLIKSPGPYSVFWPILTML